MGLLLTIGTMIVGLVAGWLARYYRLPKGVRKLASVTGKNKRDVVLLDSGQTTYMVPLAMVYRNIGITENKEAVVIPPGTLKFCPELGIKIGHGCLHRRVTVPVEIASLVSELREAGYTDEEISRIFEQIHQKSLEDMEKELAEKIEAALSAMSEQELEQLKEQARKNLEASGIKKPGGEMIEHETRRMIAESLPEQHAINVYKLLPFEARYWLRTGVSRTSLHAMLKNLVAEKNLESIGTRNYIAIGIMVLLVLLGLGLAAKWLLPMITGGAGGGAASIVPPRIP